MSDPKTYQGSCHCGAVRFEADLDLSEPVASCNCSMCRRAGWLLAFVPETAFRLTSGDEVLRDYQFARKRIHHLFCPTCGVRAFSRGDAPSGETMCAVNVRCLDGVDPDALRIRKVDGRSR